VAQSGLRYSPKPLPPTNTTDQPIPKMFFASRNSPLLQNIFPSAVGEN
jgi:hypothetical protein